MKIFKNKPIICIPTDYEYPAFTGTEAWKEFLLTFRGFTTGMNLFGCSALSRPSTLTSWPTLAIAETPLAFAALEPTKSPTQGWTPFLLTGLQGQDLSNVLRHQIPRRAAPGHPETSDHRSLTKLLLYSTQNTCLNIKSERSILTFKSLKRRKAWENSMLLNDTYEWD